MSWKALERNLGRPSVGAEQLQYIQYTVSPSHITAKAADSVSEFGLRRFELSYKSVI
jgi:hypothetical protein